MARPPKGFCQCGCGERAPLAKQTDRARGYVRGEPVRFLTGHHRCLTPLEFVIEDRGYETPCRIWQRAKDREGYGVRRIRGRLWRVHVYEWTAARGPVPGGLELDHLCRQRDCAEMTHLEPVTPRENQRCGLCGVLKTHCPQGHPYDERNTYRYPVTGHRGCRRCAADAQARRRLERAA